MAQVQTPVEGVYYNPETKTFLFYQNSPGYEEYYTEQDLADLLSFAHAEKVKKDNEIKRSYNRTD